MLLFLDIDGVLHPVRTHPADHLICRPRFEQWAAGQPDVRFVITSSWRQLYPLTVLKGYFSPVIGTRAIDVTPRLYGVAVQRRYREHGVNGMPVCNANEEVHAARFASMPSRADWIDS